MSVTVIHLQSSSYTCKRCDKETQSGRAWPYYERFLPPDDPNPEGGYVHVCGDCFCLLEDHFERFKWLPEATDK